MLGLESEYIDLNSLLADPYLLWRAKHIYYKLLYQEDVFNPGYSIHLELAAIAF